MNRNGRANVVTVAGVGLFFLCLFAFIPIKCMIGAGGWGPTNTTTVTVTDKHVDYKNSGEGSESHYMVATDQGVFEVNNGLLLWTWNADEIYGRLEKGKQYEITTKGRKVVSWWIQEYPYIVQAKPKS